MRVHLSIAGLLCAAWALGDQTVAVGPGTSFSPATVTVAPGEKVTWAWAGAFHSSTSDATTGPEVWDSGLISTGTFDHTFTTPGTYNYYCVLHGAPGLIGMSGSVSVVAPGSPTPTSTPTLTPTSSPTQTPTSPLTATPTLSPTPTPTVPPSATAAPSATPTRTNTPFTPVTDPTPLTGAAIPTLGAFGKLAFALALAALAYLVLIRAAR